MKHLLTGILALLIASNLSAQIEEEIGFRYMKAKYMIETERFEEAIDAFSSIINENASYEEALLYRAQAKYQMAAYASASEDVLNSFAYKGVNAKGLAILGKSQYKTRAYQAAANTLAVYARLENDATALEYLGTSYSEIGNKAKACEAWTRAAQYGSSTAALNTQKYCGNMVVSTPTSTTTQAPSTGSSPEPASTKKDGVIKLNIPSTKKQTQGEDTRTSVPSTTGNTRIETPSNLPPEDNKENVIKVDDELSLRIYGQGLGRRRITDQPNILIISDKDGLVAVDLCVNAKGQVISAEFNDGKSTIHKQHLISLALRKAKEFYFERAEYDQQCGVMIFDIKKL